MKRKLHFFTVLLLLSMAQLASGQTGTGNGTYHFGGLGTDNSAGTGFKKQGDKFAVSNEAANVGTEMYYGPKNVTTGNLVIKAEGGSVCKRFTLQNMGFYTYYSGSKQSLTYTKFEVTLKNEGGGVIATHQISAPKTIGETTLSAIPFATAWPAIGYAGVARIELSYSAYGTGSYANVLTSPDVLTFKNITVANISAGTLPVSFGDIAAKLSAGRLQVDWKTYSETNNEKFVVQLSKDGTKWTDVGSVISKAEGGNSGVTLHYSFGLQWGDMALAGFGFFGLLLLPAARNRWLKLASAALVLSVMVSCAKESEDLLDRDRANTIKGNTYVRVAQIDRDGTTTFSEVVVVKD